jgi:hypothetical protein
VVGVKEQPAMKRYARLALLTALVPLGYLVAASIPEPPTLVYGRVVQLIGGREFPVTAGTLSWSVRPLASPAPALTLTTSLSALADGALCYRLGIPHEALVSGLTISEGTIALGMEESVHELVDITVDGQPARPLVPSTVYFALSQAGRAKAHRVDLVVGGTPADSDGDGLPDVWERAFGLDPDANDANADPDGDGLTNQQEYARGSDPRADNRAPAMLTTRLTAYAACRTGVLLDVADSDTPPAGLTMTVLALPAAARLLLTRAGTEQPLPAGATFTLAEVQAGSLVFEESAASTDERVLRLALTDGAPNRVPVLADLPVTVCRPLTIAAGWLAQAPTQLGEVLTVTGLALPNDRTEQVTWLAGHWFGRTIWRAGAQQAPSSFAPPGSAVLLGAESDDALTGSNAADLLCGGNGADTLTGAAGADVFLFEAGLSGTKVVTDFKAAEEDTLDFSAVLRGTSNRITDYLRPVAAGTDITLHVAANGNAGNYSDAAVILRGAAPGFDLTALWASGRILAAALTSPTLVSVTVAEGDGLASETGPHPGRFTLQRAGVLDDALAVTVSLTGSATNGGDYEAIGNTVTFAAGAAFATVEVRPLPDYVVEPTEKVVLTVLPGTGYEVGTPTAATVSLSDLAELVSVEAVEVQALIAEGQPGTVMVRRAGMVARPTTVWLAVSGTAAAGSDFTPLPTRVSFAAWETAVYLDVTPLPTASVTGLRESILVAVRPDPARLYTIGDPACAAIWLYADAIAAVDGNADGIPDSEDADFDGLTTAEEALLGSDPALPTLILHRGWNLVSVPGLPAGEQTLAAQLGAGFDGVVWGWQNNQYVPLTGQPMQPGRGYLVYVADDEVLDLHNLSDATGEVTLNPGWNLVGPVRGGLWPNQPPGPIYRLVTYGAYQQVDPPLLLPMNGYWVYSSAVTTVRLP